MIEINDFKHLKVVKMFNLIYYTKIKNMKIIIYFFLRGNRVDRFVLSCSIYTVRRVFLQFHVTGKLRIGRARLVTKYLGDTRYLKVV